MHGHHHAALEHEGALAAGLTREALAIAARFLDEAGTDVRRVVDLGCGPGVGTVAIADAFPAAAIVAVDHAAPMLERAAARAAGAGCGRRVETRLLDLDGDLGSLGPCELVWAAMSIHHARDEVATLRSLRTLIAPGGLVCLLERAAPLTVVVADDLGRPGSRERPAAAHGRWYEAERRRLPGALHADAYPGMLAAAGLDVLVDRTLAEAVPVPDDPALRRFAAGVLERSLRDLAGHADVDDLRALRGFLDAAEASPGAWAGTTVAISRTLLVAAAA